MSELPLVFENRVRFDETDLQGVVYYAEYFTYVDEAFNEYLRAVGHTYDEMADAGWTTHVAHAELDYVAAAGFGDVVANHLRVVEIGESSVRAAYEARDGDTGDPLAEGEVVHVAVGLDGDESVRVPDAFRTAVAEFQDDPPE